MRGSNNERNVKNEPAVPQTAMKCLNHACPNPAGNYRRSAQPDLNASFHSV